MNEVNYSILKVNNHTEAIIKDLRISFSNGQAVSIDDFLVIIDSFFTFHADKLKRIILKIETQHLLYRGKTV